MSVLRTFAATLLALGCLGAVDPKPTAETGREGAEDLFKGAVFDAFNEALGESGGKLVELGGVPQTIKGGHILGIVDDVLIDPLVAAATTDGDHFDKFDAWVKGATVGGLKVVWPAYGLVVDGGKLVIGGGIYTTGQMIEAVREQQIEAIIFGRGFGGTLGSFNNPLAEQNFLTIPKVFNAGITAQNFGEKIETREKLRELWFTDYRNTLVRELLMDAADVDAALNEGFARLEEFWRLKRAAVAAEKFAATLSRKVLAAQHEAEQAALAAAQQGVRGEGAEGGEAERSFGEDEGQIEIVQDGDAAEPLTGQVYDLVATKPDAVFEGWSVNPGHVELTGYGYRGEFDWNSPPATVGAAGFPLNLSVTCVTEKGQRMATGINASGGFTIEPKGEVPCNCDVDDAQSASLDTRATPPQGVASGTEITLRLGAFWGLGVTYVYRAR